LTHTLIVLLILYTTRDALTAIQTRKPCYRKDDRAMRPYMLFTAILFTLTATVLCVDFDSERI